MKKLILFLSLALLGCNLVMAQNKVDKMFLEVRAGGLGIFDNEQVNTYLTGDYLNLQMFGHLTDKMSYRFRQRLNKNPFDENNILNATDFAYFTYQFNDRFFVEFGKQEIYIGGYEYDYAPIDVYYWSDFCNSINQCYGIGLTAGLSFNDGDKVMLQLATSPFSNGHDGLKSLNLMNIGHFASWWHVMYSLNMAQVNKDQNIYYVALGNRFDFGNCYLELDLTDSYFSGNDVNGLSIGSKFNYNYRDKLNIFAKGGYDQDTFFGYKSAGINVFLPDYNEPYAYFGGGVELYPLDNKDLRLHLAGFYENRDSDQRFSLVAGATWIMNIIKNK